MKWEVAVDDPDAVGESPFWHPSFVKRPGSRIAFDATGRWDMGPDKLPTVRQPAQGLASDCATLEIDHCFDGWNGITRLRDARLHVCVRSELTRLVVFTTPLRDDIAIEPVSHVNNAVHLFARGAPADALGLHILQPGETMVAQMAIEAEAAA